MEIWAKLLKFKYHIAVAVVLWIGFVVFLYVAPKLVDVLAYFWPLFLSTAVCLFGAVIFSQTSPGAGEASGEKAGESIMDFVAGGQHPQGQQPSTTTTTTESES